MINIVLKCRLGNCLFQYALARHLAIKNDASISFVVREQINRRDLLGRKIVDQLSSFNIGPISYSSTGQERVGIHLSIRRPGYRDTIHREESWGFDPQVLLLKDGVYLEGYFQSEKYFKDIEEVIREDLSFRQGSLGAEAASHREMITKQNSVGLHVRRTDYLSSTLHNVCTLDYYSEAIDYMQGRLDKPRFFVFSDDIEWCSRNMQVPDCRFVDIKAAKMNPVIDLQLMSLCKHFIISNSTFSWWAAWLGSHHQKRVVTPNRWFQEEEMNELALRDTVPGDWIKIDF